MKILLDMNLSPKWEKVPQAEGWETCHWSAIGLANAPDEEIMQWALANGFIIFTHDLDFSALLSATNAAGPSVIQVRAQNIMPEAMGVVVIAGLKQFEEVLEQGALTVIDIRRSRARILPMRQNEEPGEISL